MIIVWDKLGKTKQGVFLETGTDKKRLQFAK